MVHLINFIDLFVCFFKYDLFLMPGTRLKQIGTGATKDCKSAQKPLWNIPPVNRLIGNR